MLNEARRERFRLLLHEHGDRIYSFAMTLTGNQNEAADLTAEAFARALRNFSAYDASRPFESWLYKIAQNIHFDRLRRLKTRPTVPLEDAGGPESPPAAAGRPDGLSTPEMDAARTESEEMTRRALARVPEIYREPLALCGLLGLSYERIAETLKLPVGTVRSRIFRGRRIFRRAIEPYYERGGKI